MITARPNRVPWFPLTDERKLVREEELSQNQSPAEGHPSVVEAWEKTLAHVVGLMLVMNNRL